MAFAIRNLHVLGYAGGFTCWLYRVREGVLAESLAPGYFNPAEDMMATGDMITVTAPDGGATVFIRSAKNGDVVTAVMASTAPNDFRAAA